LPRTAPTPQLRDRLTNAGIKPTPQRMRVLEELSHERDDVTAQELYLRLAATKHDIGLATVYRALNAFADAGVIDVLPHSATEVCYRLCSDEHHHHLVCSECHRVIELANCQLDDWLAREAAAAGFEPTNHRLEVFGVCADCRR
jgi:Fur family ferric uptake transcriptional regulator